MAGVRRPSGLKRQKEQVRLARARAKQEARLARKRAQREGQLDTTDPEDQQEIVGIEEATEGVEAAEPTAPTPPDGSSDQPTGKDST
jgi:hypothetical protein